MQGVLRRKAKRWINRQQAHLKRLKRPSAGVKYWTNRELHPRYLDEPLKSAVIELAKRRKRRSRAIA